MICKFMCYYKYGSWFVIINKEKIHPHNLERPKNRKVTDVRLCIWKERKHISSVSPVTYLILLILTIRILAIIFVK